MADDKLDISLTPMQEAFCQAYVRLLNGTKAAIRAGYAEGSAAVEGSRLLRIAKIQERLTALRQEIAAAEGVAKEDLLSFFKDVITADVGDLFDEFGKLRSPQDLPDDLRRVIAGVKLSKHGIEMTFVDKKWAAQMMATYLGMNPVTKLEIKHDYEGLSDAELATKAAERLAALSKAKEHLE